MSVFEAYDKGAIVPALPDREGNITEGHGFNILLGQERPHRDARSRCLRSMMRRTVIELAPELQIACVSQPMKASACLPRMRYSSRRQQAASCPSPNSTAARSVTAARAVSQGPSMTCTGAGTKRLEALQPIMGRLSHLHEQCRKANCQPAALLVSSPSLMCSTWNRARSSGATYLDFTLRISDPKIASSTWSDMEHNSCCASGKPTGKPGLWNDRWDAESTFNSSSIPWRRSSMH